jgi:hypothetical protein
MENAGNTKKKEEKLKSFQSKKRKVESEENKVATGTSEAKSSYEALYYHDVPPELIRRVAKRHTVGHKKYGVKHLNINWRIGLNDPKYIADRLNHMFEHMLCLLEDGNDKDDNLGAIAWCAGFLMEAERHAPEAFKSVLGQCKLFGQSAKDLQDKMKGLKIR